MNRFIFAASCDTGISLSPEITRSEAWTTDMSSAAAMPLPETSATAMPIRSPGSERKS